MVVLIANVVPRQWRGVTSIRTSPAARPTTIMVATMAQIHLKVLTEESLTKVMAEQEGQADFRIETDISMRTRSTMENKTMMLRWLTTAMRLTHPHQALVRTVGVPPQVLTTISSIQAASMPHTMERHQFTPSRTDTTARSSSSSTRLKGSTLKVMSTMERTIIITTRTMT